MAFTPISNTVPQYEENGVAASGYFIKFYESGTTTPTAMATDSTGTTLLDKCELNTEGYPINGSSAVFIPHINKKYKIALFRNAADADANDLASSAWPAVDGLEPVVTIKTTFVEGIDSVADIEGFVTDIDNQQISLKGWQPGSDIGGGILYWDDAKPKSAHNGDTVFSPTVPFTTTTVNYKEGLGESDPSGVGCWVRVTSLADENQVRIETLESASTAHSAELISLDSSITLVEGDVSLNESKIAQNSSDIITLQNAQGAGVVGFATKALLDANINFDDKTIAYVTNDPSSVNNGTYRKDGASGAGSWVQSSNDIATQAYNNAEYALNDGTKLTAGLAGSLAYNETFKTDVITATNLTDGSAADYILTRESSGLRIAQNIGSRFFSYSTETPHPVNCSALYKIDQISVGAGSYAGIRVGGRTYTWSVTGRVAVDGADILTGLPLLEAGKTLWIKVDTFDGVATVKLSYEGSSALFETPFTTDGVLDLVMRGTLTCIFSCELQGVNSAISKEIAKVDNQVTDQQRYDLNAVNKMLRGMVKNTPVGYVESPDYPLSVYYDSTTGSFFTNLGLTPILARGTNSATEVYVDPISGLDTNEGTEGSPKKSLYAAIRSASGSVSIIAKGGLYSVEDSFKGFVFDGSKGDLQVTSWDGNKIISSLHIDGLTYSLESGTTYQASVVPAVDVVLDTTNTTANGDYQRLIGVADLATVRTTPNSMFYDSGTLYIHTFDGRNPAPSSLRIMDGSVTQNIWISQGGTYYFEDVSFEGGGTNGALFARNSTSAFDGLILSNRSSYNYSNGDGFDINGHWTCISQESSSSENTEDGWNYHALFGSAAPEVIEVDCQGNGNGYNSSGTNNGTTLHEDGIAIRVNGRYTYNEARNVHDIETSQSWNLGCVSSNSKDNYANYAASNTAKMWIDGCASSGSTTDIEAADTASVLYKDLTSGGVFIGSGTIATY